MYFNVKTTAPFYTKEQTKALETLGFIFRKTRWGYAKIDELTEVEINTLEELLEFSKKWGAIILNNNTIEIYDDYR